MGARGAPRRTARLWQRRVRGASLMLGLWLAGAALGQAETLRVEAARFALPTDRYEHFVLGRGHNYAALEADLSDGRRTQITWPRRVFEDTAPRLSDLDRDGSDEIVVVESLMGEGARLAVYGLEGGALALRAATPPIGRSHRWLAVAGIGDLDGDGRIEIAYVDRPHLAKTLRVFRYLPEHGALEPVASLTGVTNHLIGDPAIRGGLRDCGYGPELVLATGDWQRIVAARLSSGGLMLRDLGPLSGVTQLDLARQCSG